MTKVLFYALFVPIVFCCMIGFVFVDFMMAICRAIGIAFINIFTMPNWICDCSRDILNALVDGDE